MSKKRSMGFAIMLMGVIIAQPDTFLFYTGLAVGLIGQILIAVSE